jgi:hypothetical protein
MTKKTLNADEKKDLKRLLEHKKTLDIKSKDHDLKSKELRSEFKDFNKKLAQLLDLNEDQTITYDQVLEMLL